MLVDKSRKSGDFRYRDPRRGAAMVYVLVLLLLISLVGVTLVRGAVALHRQRLNDERHAQTIRLAEAGWNRAVRKLNADPSYAGETWSIPAEQLSLGHAAEVVIDVTEGDAGKLRVTAIYPLESPHVTRFTVESNRD
jgi:type II secretory pathway component PulK